MNRKISRVEDLKSIYNFFHGVTKYLNSSARVVILSGIPEEAEGTEAQTASQSLTALSKSLSKELGPKGTSVNLIQIPKTPDAIDRASNIAQFFLSDHSAFITGQIVQVSTLAAPSKVKKLSGSLAGKTVLVTGAVGGIGQSTVLALAEEVAHVICLDHASNAEQLKSLAKRVEGTALPLSLGEPDNPQAVATAIENSVGYVDILVHNAGITRDKTIKRMTEKFWDQVIAVNLKSVMEITDHLIEKGLLRDFGKVICLSSISGVAGNFGQTNYAASKAGLIGYVKALSQAQAEKGITANCIAPGCIETPMTAKIPFFTRQFGRRLATLSQGGLPNDVANAICFLASEASQGVNGSVLRVCGGHMMGA